MTRRPGAFCALLLCCTLAASLAGCRTSAAAGSASVAAASTVSSPAEAPFADDGPAAFTPARYPYTFTDDTGRTVALTARPERVAVLFSSYAELWANAGGEIAVTVGDAVERGYAPADAVLVDDGAGMKIDLEALVAAQPDFVIASADMSAQADACSQLSAMGIPCAAFQEESLADYLRLTALFCALTGDGSAREQAQNVAEQAQATIDAALDAAARQPVKVLFIRAGSGYSATRAKTAKDHFVGQMLADLGTENIADAAGALSEGLALESVLENPPDVILIVPQGDEEATRSYMDSVLAEPGWRDLDAVREGRCFYLEKDLFHYKPNGRWAEAYARLAALLYPEVFQ